MKFNKHYYKLKNIQNVALGEKGINTALETVADRLLFGKLFPNGTVPKGLINKTKKIGKDILEQAVTEAGTEGMQESVSVGAEKLLGINQGNWQENLSRIGEASALGGLTGGVLGGVTSATSRDYNSQFPDNNNNAIKADTIDNSKQQETNHLLKKAVKEVSAQLYNGGKELYNSTSNGINNAVTDINNTVNQPAAFDVLKELSRNGDLQNQIQTIAPNTMQKIQEDINNSSDIGVNDTGLPNLMTEDENLYNIYNNGENEITSQNEVKETAKEVKETSQKETNSATLEKPKTEIEKKIEEIAPNTTETKGNHTKDFIKGNIVKDVYTNEVFEVVEPDKKGMGHLRNVDTDEITTTNAHNNARYEIYKPDEKEYIKTQEFKYDPKATRLTNADNYVLSQQEVVNAYNDYIKNPTIENKEKYQDVYGKYHSEYTEKESNFKGETVADKSKNYKYTKKYNKFDGDVIELSNKKGENLGYISYSNEENKITIDYVKSNNIEKGVSDKLVSKLIKDNPNKDIIWDCVSKESEAARKSFIRKHPELENKVKGLWYQEVQEQFKKDEKIALNRQNEYNPQKEDISNATSDNDRFNEEVFRGRKENISDDTPTQQRNSKNKSKNDSSRGKSASSNSINGRRKTSSIKTKIKKIAPETAEKQNKDIDISKLKQDIIDLGFNADDVNDLIDRMANNEPLGSSNMYRYGVTIGQRLYANNKHHDYEKLKKQYLKNISNKKQDVDKISKNGNNKEDIENGHVEVVNGNRPELQEKQEETSSRARGISQETSADDGFTDEIRRENNISDEQRGLTEADRETISKQYKNQHELNQAIEKFINDNEIEKYTKIPEEIKEWLKKYTGAGGLEKQGAEGKGLLSEYYTPKNIVNKMWDLTAQYINTDGAKVLEPSVGIGRFLKNAPQNTSFDVFEINPISAKITKVLYPDTNVTTGEFQEKFINKVNNTTVKTVNPEYDIVIGNPPY